MLAFTNNYSLHQESVTKRPLCSTEASDKAAVFFIRVHAAGRTCEEAGGGGHHPVHPGEALQEDGEP